MHLPDADTQAAIALSCSSLIDMLDELYPERSPDLSDPERLVWMKAGKRELVRDLLTLRGHAPIRRG
jgi:hypothetical protein